MEKSFLKAFPDPFFEILELEMPQEDDLNVINENLQNIMNQCFFPTVNKDMIPDSKEDFKEYHNYSFVLQNVEFYFPFYPHFLEELIKIEGKLVKQEKNIGAIFILFSYNTWVAIFEKLQNPEFLTLLLKTICVYLDSTYDELLTRAFINLLVLYIEEGDFSSFDDVFPAIRAVFLCCKKLPPAALLVFPEILKGLILRNADPMIESLLEFFAQRVQITETKDANESAMRMMKFIAPKFLDFDIKSQLFYSQVSRLFNDELSQYFVEIAVDSIIGEIKRSTIKTDYPIAEHIKGENNNNSNGNRIHIQVNFCFPEVQSYKNGFNIKSSDVFSSKVDTDLIFDEKICQSLKYIVTGLCKKQCLIDLFFKELLEKLQFEKENISVPLFAFICNEVIKSNKQYETLELSNIIPVNQFFSPQLICTKENCKEKKYLMLNSIRNIIAYIFLKSGSKAFDKLLGRLIKYPVLFAETIYRMLYFGEESVELMKKDSSTPTFIANYIVTFKQMNEVCIENAEFARTAVIHVLTTFFNLNPVQQHFFSNSYFVSCYLSLLFENSLRKFIMSICKNYLSNSNTISSTLPLMISKISGLLVVAFPSKDYLKLATEIINLLYNCILIQREYSLLFRDTNYLLKASFMSLDDSEESRSYFLSCINLFAVSTQNVPLNEADVKQFDAGIRSAFPGKQNTTLILNLIHYLSGDREATTESNFLICEPYILFVLFNLYRERGELKEICSYIERLCRYSKENCNICNSSKFDCFIIDKIKEVWFNEDKKEEITMMFELFKVIANVVSSENVINHCIELLAPKEGKISPNACIALSVFTDLLTMSYMNPTLLIQPIIAKKILTNKLLIKERITFLFWLRIDEIIEDYHPIILEIGDQDFNTQMQIYTDNKSLIVKHNECSYTASSDLEEGKWNFIGVTLTKSSLEININGNECNEISIINLEENSITASFGGVTEETKETNTPYFLSSFGGFADLKKEEIMEMSGKSCNWMKRMRFNTYFIYDPPEQKQENNFAANLTNNCNFISFIPIFKFLSAEQKESTAIIDKTLDLFSNALLWSVETEKEFTEMKSFTKISFLLKNFDKSFLTYKLYLKFFSFFKVITHRPLKQHLINEILMDIDIWYRAEGAEQLQIYSHWTTELLDVYRDYVKNSISFASILMKVVLVFRENKECRSCAYHQTDDVKALDIRTMLRQVLIRLSTQITEFRIKDYNLLSSVCVASDDNSFVLELVQFVDQMVLAKPSPLNAFRDKGETLIMPLLLLFQRSNPEINIAVIDTIIDMYNYNAVKYPSLAVQINMLIRRMKADHITNELIYHLSQRLLDCFDLLPLLMWCLANTDPKKIDLSIFLKKLEPENWEKYWPVWPLILLKCKDRGVILGTLKFIIINEPDRLIDKYNAIEIVCELLGMDSYDIKRIFIMELVDLINENQLHLTHRTLAHYCEIVQSFFFLNRRGPSSKQLLSLFEESPFNESAKAFKAFYATEQRIAEFDTPESLIQSICKVPKVSPNIAFGIKLTDDLKWKDRELALRCITILESNIERTLPLLLIFYYFLTKDADPYPKEININVNDKLTDANKNLIRLVQSQLTNEAFDENSVNTMQQFVQFMVESYKLRYDSILSPLQSFVEDCNNLSEKAVDLSSSSFIKKWESEKERYINLCKERKMKIKNDWEEFWSKLTNKGSPFENAI